VARSLEEGVSLPDALRRFPNVFPEEFPPLVEAGFEGGHLAEVLRHAERYHSLRAKLSKGLSRILIYVGTCFAVCIGLLIFLAFLSEMLLRIERSFFDYWVWDGGLAYKVEFEWPVMTRLLMWLATDALAIFIAVAIGLVVLWALGRLFRDTISRTRIGYWLPAWGRVQKSRDLGLFCTAMALRLGTGAPVQESLRRAAYTVPNRFARKQVLKARAKVEEGESLSNVLYHSRLFPRTLSWGVSAGESRGEVSGVFRMFAELYTADLERSFELLFYVLTPIGLLVVGIIVILMVWAFYSPLFWMF
jgi:type II secretory pathway component PulF